MTTKSDEYYRVRGKLKGCTCGRNEHLLYEFIPGSGFWRARLFHEKVKGIWTQVACHTEEQPAPPFDIVVPEPLGFYEDPYECDD